jgi:hypothetical protein
MATLTGNNGALKVNGISVGSVRNFSVEMTADTIETSVMTTDVRTYVAGLSSFSGSADVYFDATDYDTNETTFNPTAGLVGASAVSVVFYIEQNYSSTSDYAFTGNVIVTGYTVNTSFDGMVEASITFQGTGATVYGTGAQ